METYFSYAVGMPNVKDILVLRKIEKLGV